MNSSGVLPLSLIYGRLHDRLRDELQQLRKVVAGLQNSDNLSQQLQYLRTGFNFILQVYRYHSTVEDEVVYPALDSFVKNVTPLYVVEHQDDIGLLEDLLQMLDTICYQQNDKQTNIRSFQCKVEAVHVSLLKHLDKEEQQLYPLLVQHLSQSQQAQMIAKLLCCIPLTRVPEVIQWWLGTATLQDKKAILQLLESTVPDARMLQLFTLWLCPPTSNIQNAQIVQSTDKYQQYAFSSEDQLIQMQNQQQYQLGQKKQQKSQDCVTHVHNVRNVGSLGHNGFCIQEQQIQQKQYQQQFSQIQNSNNDNETHLSQKNQFLKYSDQVVRNQVQNYQQQSIYFSPDQANLNCSQLQQNQQEAQLCTSHSLHQQQPQKQLFDQQQQVSLYDENYKSSKFRQQDDFPPFTNHIQESTLTNPNKRIKNESPQSSQQTAFREQLQYQQKFEHEPLQCSFVNLGVSKVDPLGYIYKLHELIRNGMKDFVRQIVDAQLPYSCIVPQQWEQMVSLLKGLLSCHRFLQALCDFHCSSEDDVMFPAAREKSPDSVLDECGTQHREQVKLFDQVGRLLSDLRGAVRRQSIEMLELLRSLQVVAGKSGISVDEHMKLEEQFILPRLERCMDLPTKCELVWQSFKAMPLRMLRKILPKLVANDNVAFAQFLTHIVHLHKNQNECLILCELLWEWSNTSNTNSSNQQSKKRRKRRKNSPSCSSSSEASLEQQISFQPIDHIFRFHKALTREIDLLTKYAVNVEEMAQQHAKHATNVLRTVNYVQNQDQTASEDAIYVQNVDQMDAEHAQHGQNEDEIDSEHAKHVANVLKTVKNVQNADKTDSEHAQHAYKVEDTDSEHAKYALSVDKMAFEHAKYVTDEIELTSKHAKHASNAQVTSQNRNLSNAQVTSQNRNLSDFFRLVQKLSGCFEFLWGIYQAHSNAEDKFVFPALEKKQALRNVSHAYMLEHQKEESLFLEISELVQSMIKNKECDVNLARELRDKCVALRAALNTHIRSEESEIWPLFKEHFSIEEQQELVLAIASQTGAEVLWRLIPFVQTTLQPQQAEAIKNSIQLYNNNLNNNNNNNMFEDWLASITHGQSSPYFDQSWQRIFSVNSYKVESALRAQEQPNDYLLANFMASQYIVAQTGNNKESSSHTSNMLRISDMSSMQLQESVVTYFDKNKRILGCSHYQRRCRLVASCCGEVVTCRICHDMVQDHSMNRYLVTEMICMICNLRQPVNSTCSACQTQMANYYCQICRFFDDDDSHSIYHCSDCNICRVGKGPGVDSFHCTTCNTCTSLHDKQHHKCRENVLDDAVCPICLEKIKDSVAPIKELHCGHFMHVECFEQYTKYNYTCPICCKTIGNMSLYFKMLDSVLAMEQLPLELQNQRQNIMCNDCGKSTVTQFHYVYHKCTQCASYNTRLV